MSALAIILALVAVAGIVAVRHADRRQRHEELEAMRRRITVRRITQTIGSNNDEWWMQ
jgi:hypothetical protein